MDEPLQFGHDRELSSGSPCCDFQPSNRTRRISHRCPFEVNGSRYVGIICSIRNSFHHYRCSGKSIQKKTAIGCPHRTGIRAHRGMEPRCSKKSTYAAGYFRKLYSGSPECLQTTYILPVLLCGHTCFSTDSNIAANVAIQRCGNCTFTTGVSLLGRSCISRSDLHRCEKFRYTFWKPVYNEVSNDDSTATARTGLTCCSQSIGLRSRINSRF